MLEIFFATIHPKFIESYSEFGVYKSAIKNSVANISALNLRDYAVDKHGSIDGYPYGGGDSMVMRPEPIKKALDFVKEKHSDPIVIYTSPRGKPWNQQESENLFEEIFNSKRPLFFICGRFAGLDQRIVDQHVEREYSLGDFVISGGELPSLTIADSVLRHAPGSLGNQDSVEFDSFSKGLDGLLEYPVYTRPAEFEGQKVPEVLLSGDHSKIAKWRSEKSIELTKKLRPDLLKK